MMKDLATITKYVDITKPFKSNVNHTPLDTTYRGTLTVAENLKNIKVKKDVFELTPPKKDKDVYMHVMRNIDPGEFKYRIDSEENLELWHGKTDCMLGYKDKNHKWIFDNNIDLLFPTNFDWNNERTLDDLSVIFTSFWELAIFSEESANNIDKNLEAVIKDAFQARYYAKRLRKLSECVIPFKGNMRGFTGQFGFFLNSRKIKLVKQTWNSTDTSHYWKPFPIIDDTNVLARVNKHTKLWEWSFPVLNWIKVNKYDVGIEAALPKELRLQNSVIFKVFHNQY